MPRIHQVASLILATTITIGCDRGPDSSTPSTANTAASAGSPSTSSEPDITRALGYLRAAEKAAAHIDAGLRPDAYVRIAQARIAAGDVAGGLAVVEAVKTEIPRLTGFSRSALLRQVLQTETAAGRFDEAEATYIRLAPPGPDSLDALQTLGEGLADRPMHAMSLIVRTKAQLSSRPDVEARIWLALARAEVKAQNVEHAVSSLQSASRVASNVSDASSRAALCFDIASTYGKAQRDADAAALLVRGLEAARSIPLDDWGGRSRAIAQGAAVQAALARTGSSDTAGAGATFHDAIAASEAMATERRVVILSDIAQLQRNAGDKAGADATVQTAVGLVNSASDTPSQNDRFAITQGTRRGLAGTVAARAQAESGRFDEAMRMARSVRGHQRSIALCEVASVQAKAGRLVEAAATLKEAQNAQILTGSKSDKVAVIVAIGMAQITLGDQTSAVATAEDLEAIDAYQSVRLRVAAAESLVTQPQQPQK